MAFPQLKRRFSFFNPTPKSSPTKSPPLTSQNLYTSSYFPSKEISEDDNPTPDDIRKSIENLEKLILAADEYKDCLNKLSKISKNFSKCLKDYSNCKGIDKPHAQCIQFTSQFYENYAEIQSKLNKALQKEFETLQKFWDKYSKKVAKDEKAHNDHVGDLDKQIKKISKDHEKKSKKENKYALENHDKYIASLTSLGSDIARARTEYAVEVTRREKHTHSVISQLVCRLIEGQFASFNDLLKKCGPNITKVKEWAYSAGQDMPSLLDLDSFLEMQIMTLPSESDNNDNNNDNHDNHDDELMSSGKPSRRFSYGISKPIASISEIQKAVMNIKSQEIAPLTEKFEKIEESLPPKSRIPTTSISEKSPDNVFSISVETTTTTVITNVNEDTNNKSIISSVPPIVTASAEINPPISSTNFPNLKEKPSSTKNKPLTPDLLSSFSIGIRDDDNPFFRDSYSKKMISSDVITETTDLTSKKGKETKQVETISIIQGSSVNNNEKESSKLEENNIVSLTPPPIYDKNDIWTSLKKDQSKNGDNSPIRNTFRLSFIGNNQENENTLRLSFIGNNQENEVKKSIDKESSNKCDDDEYQAIDNKSIISEKEIRSTSSFETERLVKSFPIDLPVRPIPQNLSKKNLRFSEDKSGEYNRDRDHDRDHDQMVNNNKETILYQHSNEGKHVTIRSNDNMYVTYPPTHSTKSNEDESPPGHFKPRRAYTDYPLPLSNSKRGPSVADIRDRLLSLNTNEKRLSTRPTYGIPKPKQGYVNEVKSKFGGMNNLKNNNNSIIPKSSDGNNNFKDDMYLDQVENSEVNATSPSKSITNEQCNCHNCQEMKRIMDMNDVRNHNHNHYLKDSFLPEDDLTTFGRNY